jgi:hypothetical protein
MRHFSKCKNMTCCARVTYDSAARARPILGFGASRELGAWDLEFHRMTHFERKEGWGCVIPDARRFNIRAIRVSKPKSNEIE